MSDLWNKLEDSDEIMIYGTAKNGLDALFAMSQLFSKKIGGFIVSKRGARKVLCGYPIYEIKEYQSEGKNVCVIVAVREDYYSDIVRNLKNRNLDNFFNYCDYNSHMMEIHSRIEDSNTSYCVKKNNWKRSQLLDIAGGL